MSMSTSSKITASLKFDGTDITGIPVLNPGGWFGKVWLVEIGGSYDSLFIAIEADSVSDAIDELSDSDAYGHQIHVAEEDLGDYPEDERHYDGSGRVINLDHVMVHGWELAKLPYPMTYHGEGLPDDGVSPLEYDQDKEEVRDITCSACGGSGMDQYNSDWPCQYCGGRGTFPES